MIRRTFAARWRVVAPVLLGLIVAQAFATPALADDPPPGTRTFTVTRGGQTFERSTFEVELAPDGRLMRAGSFIVKFLSQADPAERDDAHRISGALGAERLLSADMFRVQVGRSKSLAALMAYASHRAVERVEPDYVAHTMLTPNDTHFSQQWGMTKIRAGSPAGSTAQSAWDVTKSSAQTRIAILDCGVYNPDSSAYLAPDGLPGHPDLRGGKVIDNKNFTTAPDSDDYCNHGTHVAGIAAANTNNNEVGVAGVGYDASIVNVKVLGDNGSGSFTWIINGILYAAGCDLTACGTPGADKTKRRAEIINMSLGATGACSSSVQDAIDKAWAQGLVIAAAAGNSGKSGAITPANCNNVIGVAASDQNDAKASFSNFGAGVDVAAPGVSILSTNYVGGYSSFNGTSMASPHVAGLAALVWTTEQNAVNQCVVDRITSTANKEALAGSTYGRIDAYAAVVSDPCGSPSPPPPPPQPLPSLSINNVSANEGNLGPTSFSFTVSRSGGSGETSVKYSTANGTASAGTDYTAVTTDTVNFTGSETNKTITVSVNGDTAAEPNETFFVNLSDATNATIADSQGVGTIVNDDLPSLAIADASRNEGNSGTRTLTLSVALSPSSSETVTVSYATANGGTATGGSSCGSGRDYRTRSGSITFSPGQTSRTVSVTICGDRTREPNETFLVNLTNPVNAVIGDGQAVGTIVNDD